MKFINNIGNLQDTQIEPNSLINGDCLEVMKFITDKSIDMIFCDLPYGTTACSWDTIIPFDKLWESYDRIIKDNTPIILTASQPFTSALVMSNPKWFRHEWIWEKHQGTNPLTAEYAPMKCHESILVFSRKGCKYNPQMAKGKPYSGFASDNGKEIGEVYNKLQSKHSENNGTRYPRSIQKFKIDNDRFHPTQKPISMLNYIINTYSDKDNIILDNCSGSGTTAICAINNQRKFICIEQDENYFNQSKERIKLFESAYYL